MTALEYFNLSQDHFLENEFEEALEHIEEAINLEGDNPRFWEMKALCHRHLDE